MRRTRQEREICRAIREYLILRQEARRENLDDEFIESVTARIMERLREKFTADTQLDS